MDNKQKLVVVLGMHRSGTSAVTRGLTVLGVSLGASLLHSQSDNVKGFWEDSDIKILNQDMLRHLARDWHSLSLLPEPERLIEQLSPFYWRAADLLANKVQEVDAFGFKDPRTCLLIPFWKHVFSQADLDVKYVVVTRHPLSIARSLQARNHFSPEKSLYLWLEYMLSAVTAILDDVAVVVDYDFLMDRPESELIRVAEHLGLGAPEAEALNVYSNDYLDVRLRHTHYTNSDLEKVNILTGDMVIASEAFRKLAMDQWRLDSASVREVFFSLRSGLLARRDLLSYLDRCELQLSDRERRLADFETAIKRRDEKVSACEQRIADFETAIKRRDEKVSACEQRITDFETAIKRRDEKVSAYERRVADFETAIKRRDEKIGALASGDKEKSRHLQQAESAVKETLRENNRLDKALAQQSLKLTGVLGSLQQREGQLRSLEGALKRHEKTIRALNEDKKLSQSSVRQLKGQLAKANEQLQLQQTLLATRAQEQEQEQQARDKVLQQEVSRLEVEVDMLRQSFGWLAEQRLRQWTRQSGQWLKRKGAAYEPEPCEAADHPEPSALPLVVVPEPVATLAPEMALVQASGLFDADWYLAHNPDVMQAGVDPLQHYFHFGAEERRDPHPLFASGWYLKSYPDIARAGANPLVHYLRLGFREGREPHPFFSGRDYMQRYSGVALGDLSPLQHYVQVGWQAGYEAHVLFDRGQYLSEYPELEGQAGYTAFAHCLKRFMAHRKKPLAPLAADRSVHAAFDREQEGRFIERIRHWQKMRQGDAGAPLVSIVMATRNRCAEIGSDIESILA
ncbi:MAG: sulfotransferase [Thiothrix sp.]|nr:sulfotransferase [Thiothrix sp.]